MAKKKNPTDDKRAPEVIFAEAHDSEVARSVASLAARIWSASSAAIANRLVWARSRSGISLVEAGNAIKLSPQAIQQWESGKTLPTIDRYGELGQIYGIDPIWLSSGIMTTGIDEDTSKVLAKLPRPVATRGRPPSKPMEAKPEAPSLTGVRVPLFNSERRAVDAINDEGASDDIVFLPVDPKLGPELAWIVQDDRNFPTFMPGDIVAIDRRADRVRPGRMVLASTVTDGLVFGKLQGSAMGPAKILAENELWSAVSIKKLSASEDADLESEAVIIGSAVCHIRRSL